MGALVEWQIDDLRAENGIPESEIMFIDNIEWGPYELPLVQPLALPGREITTRQGLLVRLSSGALTGVGDVAPLPGFSTESIEEAQACLDALPIIDCALDIDALLQGRCISALHDAPPSVRFGVECALLEMAAQQGRCDGNPLAPCHGEVSVNALLAGVTAEALTSLVDQGYRCIKIKVGRQPLAQDLATLDVLKSLPETVALRLDANRAWSLSDARHYVNALEGVALEYLEEPCESSDDSVRLARETGVPIALDESLLGLDDARLAALTDVVAFVIKPTLAGGVSGAIRLAKAARQCGAEPVISAAFESGVGIRALAFLAHALMTPGVAAGLDTWRWLACDVVDHSGPRSGPLMRLNEGAS